MPLQSYEMKDSGVEWIGEIPKDWDKRCLKTLLTVLRGGSPRPIEEYLTDSPDGINWIKIGDTTKGTKVIFSTKQKIKPSGVAKSRMVHKGDLLLTNSMSFGEPYFLEVDGCIHDGWVCLTNLIGIDKLFLYYFLCSDFCTKQFQLQVDGGVVQNLNIEKIGKTIIFLPSMHEQQSIAAYLDEKCVAIDEIIAEAKATIDEYKSWKASVIFEAVTKGLNPNAEMKDSGVEWIGRIPKDWKVISLRYLGKCQNGISKDGEAFGSGFPFVSYTDVYKNIVLPGEASRLVESTEDERERYSVKYGDIFFTRTSETIEEIGFSSVCLKTIDNATFAGFLIRFRPTNNKLYPEYSKYYFRSELQRRYFVKEMTLVTRASLGQELLKSMPVILPPFETQQKIAAYLDEKCAAIDGVIAEKEALIGELESYKKSLIFETVTGKRRVC